MANSTLVNPPATPKPPTNETLSADMWRACDILRRDNNVGGIMQYTEHLAWLLFLRRDIRVSGEGSWRLPL